MRIKIIHIAVMSEPHFKVFWATAGLSITGKVHQCIRWQHKGSGRHKLGPELIEESRCPFIVHVADPCSSRLDFA